MWDAWRSSSRPDSTPRRRRERRSPRGSPQVTDETLNDAQLLVSELVTNSVCHAQLDAGATVRVSVEICDRFVRLEVEDPGDVAIGAVAPDREHGGGFGLFLVEALAQRWGSKHEGTTCVWAELAIAPAT
jgi:anti-sigma regulatory factor (Ser/Thr protein kinase)